MTGTSTELALPEASLAITGDWSYEDCVEAARRAEDLAGRAASWRCWYLGDLAAKVETSYAAHSLDEFARDIGVPAETVRAYRSVARAFESGRRLPNLPWSVYQALAGQPRPR